jgi:topoisomerase IA-like protein
MKKLGKNPKNSDEISLKKTKYANFPIKKMKIITKHHINICLN